MRTVPRDEWKGRRDNAREFLTGADALMERAQAGRSCNPIVTLCVNAAIAWGDAVTIKFGGMVNAGNHHALEATIQRVIGARFSDRSAQQLSRILGQKDEAAYGAHSATQAEAREILKLTRRFAAWAETELARPG
ncbi:MAG: hypothetical protein ACREL5_05835 [Gemmatimonadales bacterium]